MQDSIPRGVIDVEKCLSIKGAEDVVNKPHAFEISTHSESMFYIADTDKEKVQIDNMDQNNINRALGSVATIRDSHAAGLQVLQRAHQEGGHADAAGRLLCCAAVAMVDHMQDVCGYGACLTDSSSAM